MDDLAGGEDAVVHAVVVLGEEHVATDLAAEEDPLLAHLALEVRVPRLPHHGHATVRPDVVDQRLRGLHVEDVLGARVALQEVAGEQDQDEIGLVTAAALVHDAHAIGVAVVGDAEIGADLDDSGLEVHDVRRVLRVGEVMGEAAVRLAVELNDPTPDAAQELRRVEPGDAVARDDAGLSCPTATRRPAFLRISVPYARPTWRNTSGLMSGPTTPRTS